MEIDTCERMCFYIARQVFFCDTQSSTRAERNIQSGIWIPLDGEFRSVNLVSVVVCGACVYILIMPFFISLAN
jgi:hypothetical protein